MNIQKNKLPADYRLSGVTCNIMTHVLPMFIWNVDEKRIVEYPDTHQVVIIPGRNNRIELKPGNQMASMSTYTELDDAVIAEINDSYGIVIQENTDTAGEVTDHKYYRFAIVK